MIASSRLDGARSRYRVLSTILTSQAISGRYRGPIPDFLVTSLTERWKEGIAKDWAVMNAQQQIFTYGCHANQSFGTSILKGLDVKLVFRNLGITLGVVCTENSFTQVSHHPY